MLCRRWLILAYGFLLGLGDGSAVWGNSAAEPTAAWHVNRWTVSSGLPENTVSALCQSREGYLWVATHYGLARFDGVRLTQFVEELSAYDPETLTLQALAPDAHDTLWLCSGEALLTYRNGVFRRMPLSQLPFPGSAAHLAACRDGGVWVAKDGGLFHLNSEKPDRVFTLSQLLHRESTASLILDRVQEDSRGRLWLRVLPKDSEEPEWFRIDLSTMTLQSLGEICGVSLERVGAVLEDRAGRLWAGRPGELVCWDGKLARFAAGNTWEKFQVQMLAEDMRGDVWILSTGPSQLHQFHQGRFTTFGAAEGITNPTDLRSLLIDREGNVWVGSGNGGLFQLQPRALASLLTGSYAAMDEVYSVSPGPDSRIWLATSYGVVAYLNGGFTVYTNLEGTTRSDQLLRIRPALADRAGQVWCGLDHIGLQFLTNGLITRDPQLNIPGRERQKIRSLLEDQSGNLWIAASEGLWQRRQGKYRNWSQEHQWSASGLFGLAEGPDGSVWVGSERSGLHRVQGEQVTHYSTADGLLHDNAWPLRVEPDGTVWVATPRGLNRIRNREVRAVTTAQGLYDNLLYCLLEDGRGRYWTFCNRGIWRVRKNDLHAAADGHLAVLTCVNYGEADGMGDVEGNGDQQPNAAAAPNGDFWFPTTHGVVVLSPDKITDNQVPPDAVIEELRADEETIFQDGKYSTSQEVRLVENPRSPAHAREIRLPAGRARVLEIRYTANTFVDGALARFRYRLAGHESSWQEARNRRIALYTNLRPGAYRFQVEACNSHGYWSEKPAEIAFALAPHFYETWWFRSLCGVAAAAGLACAHFLRLNAKGRRHRDQQRQMLEAERTRIAKDLHDDLGANLTGLALQLEAARRLPAIEDQQKRLEDSAASLRGVAGRMRELIWAINPECDTLESFSLYLGQYAEQYLRAAGIRCRLDTPLGLPPHGLSAQTRHHLFLVAKEALHNAVRHAGATEVRVGVNVEDSSMLLTLSDNGRGWSNEVSHPLAPPPNAAELKKNSPPPPGSGHGLKNMRKRVETMGGEFTLHSAPERGTRITVRIPLAPLH